MGKNALSRDTHPIRVWLLLLGLALVVGINVSWFLRGELLEHTDAFRMTVGAFLIFLVPGLVGGELLGLRGRSPLETIALAFAVTLALEIVLLAVVLCLGTSIAVWVGLLLGTTALGTAVVAGTIAWGKRPTFLIGLVSLPPGSALERVLHALVTLAPWLLGAVAYGWGEQVADLGGEKYIHMTFVRYYAEMPLVLANLGIERGLPPPNLVHLWEFLLAGWATCVRIDPLPLFTHARMVVPVLGLAGMYLLTRLVFLDWKKSTAVFAGILLLCAGQVLHASASLTWINAGDPTRGVLAFFGTAHHADSAADILLALTAGMVLLFMRQPRPVHALLLAGTLAANFLWHPREFLQAALYLGVLGPTALLLPSLRRRVVLGRWLAAFGILVGVAVTAATVSATFAPNASHGYDESALKTTALNYALEPGELYTVRSLFNYPLHLMLSTPMTPDQILTGAEVDAQLRSHWNYDRWAFLAAGAMVVLVLLGGRRDRALAFYHLLLWLLAYCWNFSMLLILALTYSEFFMAMPRLLYLFSYLVIADGTLVAVTAFYRACAHLPRASPALTTVLTALAVGLAHYALMTWMHRGHAGAQHVATVLNAGCLALLFAIFLCEGPHWNALRAVRAVRQPLPLALAVLLIGAALGPDTIGHWRNLLAKAAPGAMTETDWFGNDNPFGYSREFLAWARTVPGGNRFATHPLDVAMLSVYTPQYLCVQPVGSVVAGYAERQSAARGAHPFYRPHPLAAVEAPWHVEHARAAEWLGRRRADYVLIRGADYQPPILSYFRAHPDLYEVAFESSVAKEVVFRLRQEPPSALRACGDAGRVGSVNLAVHSADTIR